MPTLAELGARERTPDDIALASANRYSLLRSISILKGDLAKAERDRNDEANLRRYAEAGLVALKKKPRSLGIVLGLGTGQKGIHIGFAHAGEKRQSA